MLRINRMGRAPRPSYGNESNIKGFQMDSPKRSLAKMATWQIIGLLSMTLLAYATTGSISIAGGLALASAAMGSICYILHERIWARILWGRREHIEPTVDHASNP